MKKVAIVQSNYIPWKGYFHLIGAVDEFVLLDEVQYTKRDWRNRNQIKTPQGLLWLSIPVLTKGRYLQKICDVTIEDPHWGHKHWNSIKTNYSKAPFFKEFSPFIEEIYLNSNETHLSRLNYLFISQICSLLDIKTKITWSMDYSIPANIEDPTERLISIVKKTKGKQYLSGPMAKSYLNESLFKKENIELKWAEYIFPQYTQLYGDFTHFVSVLDLIFNMGTDIKKYLALEESIYIPERKWGT